MAEVTYYVALPFVASDDNMAAGEPTECFNPIAVVMRAEVLSRKEGHVGAVRIPDVSRRSAGSGPTQKPFHRPSRLGIPPVDKLRFVRSSLLVHERIATAESQERISSRQSYIVEGVIW